LLPVIPVGDMKKSPSRTINFTVSWKRRVSRPQRAICRTDVLWRSKMPKPNSGWQRRPTTRCSSPRQGRLSRAVMSATTSCVGPAGCTYQCNHRPRPYVSPGHGTGFGHLLDRLLLSRTSSSGAIIVPTCPVHSASIRPCIDISSFSDKHFNYL